MKADEQLGNKFDNKNPLFTLTQNQSFELVCICSDDLMYKYMTSKLFGKNYIIKKNCSDHTTLKIFIISYKRLFMLKQIGLLRFSANFFAPMLWRRGDLATLFWRQHVFSVNKIPCFDTNNLAENFWRKTFLCPSVLASQIVSSDVLTSKLISANALCRHFIVSTAKELWLFNWS